MYSCSAVNPAPFLWKGVVTLRAESIAQKTEPGPCGVFPRLISELVTCALLGREIPIDHLDHPVSCFPCLCLGRSVSVFLCLSHCCILSVESAVFWEEGLGTIFKEYSWAASFSTGPDADGEILDFRLLAVMERDFKNSRRRVSVSCTCESTERPLVSRFQDVPKCPCLLVSHP